MPGEKWTFLVFRGEDSVRQYSLSTGSVRLALALAAGAATAAVAVLALIGISGWSQTEAALLRHENALLEAELSTIQEQVAHLEGTVETLAEQDARFRVLAGLDPIDRDVLQAGVGGPGLDGPADSELASVDAGLGEETFAVRYDLGALERRVQLLSGSIAEATDSLESHRDLLERTPSIFPAAGFLSSRFSSSRYHPIHHRNLPHEGIDISASRGTPILAAAKGRVLTAARKAGYGLMVEIDHGNGYVTRYGHASKVLVRRGQRVTRGDVIGLVGSSGIATSPHLHYEVRASGRAVNPMNYVVTGAVP